MSKRALVGALAASVAFALAPDCTGREHTNVRPSEKEMEEQQLEEARQELEAEVGEAAREERLHEDQE